MSLKNLIFFYQTWRRWASDSIRRIVLNLDQKNYKIYIVCLENIYKNNSKKGINVLKIQKKHFLF